METVSGNKSATGTEGEASVMIMTVEGGVGSTQSGQNDAFNVVLKCPCCSGDVYIQGKRDNSGEWVIISAGALKRNLDSLPERLIVERETEVAIHNLPVEISSLNDMDERPTEEICTQENSKESEESCLKKHQALTLNHALNFICQPVPVNSGRKTDEVGPLPVSDVQGKHFRLQGDEICEECRVEESNLNYAKDGQVEIEFRYETEGQSVKDMICGVSTDFVEKRVTADIYEGQNKGSEYIENDFSTFPVESKDFQSSIKPSEHIDANNFDRGHQKVDFNIQDSRNVHDLRNVYDSRNIHDMRNVHDVQYLRKHGNIRECSGDGNCLFREFCDQLYGRQDLHLFIRKLAVEVMQLRKEDFQSFVDDSEGPFESFLSAKSKYGEWADHREMHALMLLYGIPVLVVDEMLNFLQIFELPCGNERRQNGGSMFRIIWNSDPGHYSSLQLDCEPFPLVADRNIGELEVEGLLYLLTQGLNLCLVNEKDELIKLATESKEELIKRQSIADDLMMSVEDFEVLVVEQTVVIDAILAERYRNCEKLAHKTVSILWNGALKEQKARDNVACAQEKSASTQFAPVNSIHIAATEKSPAYVMESALDSSGSISEKPKTVQEHEILAVKSDNKKNYFPLATSVQNDRNSSDIFTVTKGTASNCIINDFRAKSPSSFYYVPQNRRQERLGSTLGTEMVEIDNVHGIQHTITRPPPQQVLIEQGSLCSQFENFPQVFRNYRVTSDYLKGRVGMHNAVTSVGHRQSGNPRSYMHPCIPYFPSNGSLSLFGNSWDYEREESKMKNNSNSPFASRRKAADTRDDT